MRVLLDSQLPLQRQDHLRQDLSGQVRAGASVRGAGPSAYASRNGLGQPYQEFQKTKNFYFYEEFMQECKYEVQKATKAISYIMELSFKLLQYFKQEAAMPIKKNFQGFFANGLSNNMHLNDGVLTDYLIFFVEFVEHTYNLGMFFMV